MGLGYDELVEVLQLPDDQIPALLELAHAVRMKHCGPEVEVEGIISLKTGGCPEDCHFCFAVRPVHLACARGMARHSPVGQGR